MCALCQRTLRIRQHVTEDCDSRWAHLLKDISKQLLPSTQCGAEPFFFQLQLLQNPRGILLDSWVTAFRQIYGYLSHSAQKSALDSQKVTLKAVMTSFCDPEGNDEIVCDL